MKRLIIVLIVFVWGMMFTKIAVAGDAADVKASLLATLAAYNAGDVENFVPRFLPDVRGFLFDGTPLIEGFDKNNLQGLFDAGFKANLEARQVDVKIYGNTAVITAYFVGTITWPGGDMQQGSWRFSEVRIRQGGKWKVAHYHFSPLAPTQP